MSTVVALLALCPCLLSMCHNLSPEESPEPEPIVASQELSKIERGPCLSMRWLELDLTEGEYVIRVVSIPGWARLISVGELGNFSFGEFKRLGFAVIDDEEQDVGEWLSGSSEPIKGEDRALEAVFAVLAMSESSVSGEVVLELSDPSGTFPTETVRIPIDVVCGPPGGGEPITVLVTPGRVPACVEFVPDGFPWAGETEGTLLVGYEDPAGGFNGGLGVVDATTGVELEFMDGQSQHGCATLHNGAGLVIFTGTFLTGYNPDIDGAGARLIYIRNDFKDHERESPTAAYAVDVNFGGIDRNEIDALGFPQSTFRAAAEPSAGLARCVTHDPDTGTVYCVTRGAAPKLCAAPAGSTVATAVADLDGEFISVEYCKGWLWTTDLANDRLLGFRLVGGVVEAGGPHFELATGDEPVDVEGIDIGNGFAACWTAERGESGGHCVVWDTTTLAVVHSGTYDLPGGCSGCAYIGFDEDEDRFGGACPGSGNVFTASTDDWLEATVPGFGSR